MTTLVIIFFFSGLFPAMIRVKLMKTCYAFKKGHFTLRIPNFLVKNQLADTTDYIASFVELGRWKSYR